MKILVTGFSGFIGSHLTDRLLSEGHEVIGVDRSIKFANIQKDHPNLKMYHEDILGNIADLFKDVQIVFHLAALTRPQWSIKYPYETTQANVLGTVKVLEHCKNNGIKRIVFMSSSNLYGNVDKYPTPEDVTPNPMNSYALSKFIGEQYCKLFDKLYSLEWNACRPFNAYGKRMPTSGIYTSAVATFINAIKTNQVIETYGTGEQRRDFIYIDDIVNQLMLMATSEEHGEAFNCGSGTNNSIKELLELVCKISNKNPINIKHPAQFEPDQTLADISKAEKLLGWKPKISFEEGLRRTIE